MICHKELRSKSDSEIFELIWKANKFEENHPSKHLTLLENKVWSNCHISIDETTDAYLITMLEQNGMIKFIWQGWREPCPFDKIDKIFSITVDKNFVVETIESCLTMIENEYLNFPVYEEKKDH